MVDGHLPQWRVIQHQNEGQGRSRRDDERRTGMTETGSGRHAETLPVQPPSDLQCNFHQLAM